MGPFRILIIDDSEVLLARMKRVLVAEGYDVTTTSQTTGNARHLPSTDLVIIDFHMPGLDGKAVVESLRAAANARHFREATKDDAGDRGSSAGVVSARTPRARDCLFYLYTSDTKAEADFHALGFDGVLTAKGDDAALARQVAAIARLAQIRALRAKK